MSCENFTRSEPLSVSATAGETVPSPDAIGRQFGNWLACYFARLLRDDGLCGDVIVDDADASDSSDMDDFCVDESSDELEGTFVQIGTGSTLHVVADPTPTPCSEFDDPESRSVFASFETLHSTVFTFSCEPDGWDEFESWAESLCSRHGLRLMGVCFIDETLECLAIASGTRRETEEQVLALWRETEGTPGASPKTAVAE